jgi:hypothetical protein
MYNLSFLDLIKSYKNNIKLRIKHLTLFRKKYKNYVNVVYRLLRNQYPIIAHKRNGNNITFRDYLDLYQNMMDIQSDPEEDIVYVSDIKLYGGRRIPDIGPIFVQEVYKFLPVNDKVVVDIGASIADSSIYFASRGAKKVLALEPGITRFELAKKNISANNFSDKIEIIQAECIGMKSEDHDGVKLNQSMTLEQIIKKLEQSPPEILKMACAGCEYDVLLNTPDEIIAKFNHIQLQYLFGYRNLKQKLEKCGFHVTFSGPRYVKFVIKNPRALRSHINTDLLRNIFFGYIYAKKIKS